MRFPFRYKFVAHRLRRLYSQTSSKFIKSALWNSIAYRRCEGGTPGIIYCPGFQSTMTGVKATALELFCRTEGLAYVRFDYEGCGESSGDLKKTTISDWRSNILCVLDQVTSGPQVLVGSSMGGLLMLYTALDRPHRVHALVGLATAADFPSRGFSSHPKEAQSGVKETGVAHYTTDDGYSYTLTQRLLDDLNTQSDLLTYDLIPITCPVRLIHGLADTTVSSDVSLKLVPLLQSQDVEIILRKSGDHRLSQPEDVQILTGVIQNLVTNFNRS